MLANYAPVLIFLIISGGLGVVLLSIGLALGRAVAMSFEESHDRFVDRGCVLYVHQM